ncbi:MAG: lysophospholipase [Deltaproteobacteria bacterium]|nr:lysophospholipase [Deltaproteobacteria bacterium]
MGGLIAVRYAQRFPESIDGLIPHGASFRLALEVPKVKAALGNLMSGLWPGLTLANEVDPKVLSHDPEAVKAYLADPLVHDRISTRLFTEIMANMAEANAHAGVIAMPLLVIHGGADRLTHPEGSRAFYDAAASHDKTLKMFDGLYHETFHELDKEKVLETLREWLAARA